MTNKQSSGLDSSEPDPGSQHRSFSGKSFPRPTRYKVSQTAAGAVLQPAAIATTTFLGQEFFRLAIALFV